jgi:hypothetical protein
MPIRFGNQELRDYAQDEHAEKEHGIDVKRGSMHFYCRRMGGANVAYKVALGKHSAGVAKKARRSGDVDIVGTEEAQKAAFLDACLVGWDGIVDEQGANVPFSRSAAADLFAGWPELLEDVMAEAQTASNYALQEQKEAAEDLGKS